MIAALICGISSPRNVFDDDLTTATGEPVPVGACAAAAAGTDDEVQDRRAGEITVFGLDEPTVSVVAGAG
jgi:hypothetical protein